ncbi:phosphoglycerate mutase family protein [Hymenobacter actinosclerus]|uniref:Histidine phosphatase superfamily (Branch 1) n=1 Tax=Hymenobacter actinosclerus TaxID=82805 RepID=A0A1I0EE23_9BACT|nr:phosphoglycerate mutase family protein [Hymenobacter actinosclerus]SET43489.1 Histidine phosphatase superfamily (branch 1) [Hymenobacter actinosclerus]
MLDLLRPRLAGLLVLALLVFNGACVRKAAPVATATGPETRVYVVRHAEKDLVTDPTDPPLTPEGQARAQALVAAIPRQTRLSAVFSTDTRRTRSTAQPLADARGLPVQLYDARDLPALAARLRRDYPNQNVLVVGHSNTMLETVDALGAPRPVPLIPDEAYDYLLEVHLPTDAARPATADAHHYGVQSH